MAADSERMAELPGTQSVQGQEADYPALTQEQQQEENKAHDTGKTKLDSIRTINSFFFSLSWKPIPLLLHMVLLHPDLRECLALPSSSRGLHGLIKRDRLLSNSWKHAMQVTQYQNNKIITFYSSIEGLNTIWMIFSKTVIWVSSLWSIHIMLVDAAWGIVMLLVWYNYASKTNSSVSALFLFFLSSSDNSTALYLCHHWNCFRTNWMDCRWWVNQLFVIIS